MRKLVLAVAVGLVALVGYAVPTAGAAAPIPPVNPKVVIIVGPVAASTSSYRSDAESAAAEALKYTTNVVKLYTPHATWARVKPALQGASIVIYMGHGNGSPSPYGPLRTTVMDGLGLNPVDTSSDNTTTRYYGESFLASDVRLAPNAVVLLHHLCYSAGNSEPGNPDPTLSVAKQRVDNMAAGWLRSGARAVVADVYGSGLYGGAAWYVRQLFTTHQSLDEVWNASPTFHGHVLTFPSVRSPGFTARMDPDRVNAAPFHRSVVGELDLQTQDVTGARYAATDGDPPAFVVPGAASVVSGGAGLYGDPALTPDAGTGMAPVTLPADTKVRLDAQYPVVGGHPVFAVHTLDGSQSGYMSGSSLTPRDSQGPNVWTADDGTGAFSPNGDGRQDTFDVSGQFSEAVAWQVAFKDGAGTVLHSVAGSGSTYDATWDGIVGGSPVADGAYTFVITADDAWGNPEGSRSGSVTVDTVAPTLGPTPLTVVGPPTFTPNGDGVTDSVALAYSTNEPGFIDATVTDGASQTVNAFATTASGGAGSVTWLGDATSGPTVPDGPYTVTLAPRDLAGNVGAGEARPVYVYAALRALRASTSLFFPQDNDSYARTSTFTFTLTRPATVSWTLADALGTTMYTMFDQAALGAGTYTYAWNGRSPSGAFVPRGRYQVRVTASDGTVTVGQTQWVTADAFRISSSDTTPGRGQAIKVTAVTAESLSAAPRLTVSQPGFAAFTITMTRVASGTWRATIHLHSGGRTGNVTLKVSGYDAHRGANRSSLALPLH